MSVGTPAAERRIRRKTESNPECFSRSLCSFAVGSKPVLDSSFHRSSRSYLRCSSFDNHRSHFSYFSPFFCHHLKDLQRFATFIYFHAFPTIFVRYLFLILLRTRT